MSLTCQVAEKEHRCDTCGRLIPIGDKYWRRFEDPDGLPDLREHTNCVDYEKSEELNVAFNSNRRDRKP